MSEKLGYQTYLPNLLHLFTVPVPAHFITGKIWYLKLSLEKSDVALLIVKLF
jgi:hypothetical protein